MIIQGFKIEALGFQMNKEQKQEIESFVKKLKMKLPLSKMRLRLVKTKNLIEGMIWCESQGLPIGVYNRSTSLSQLIKSLLKRVSKEYRKAHKKTALNPPWSRFSREEKLSHSINLAS